MYEQFDPRLVTIAQWTLPESIDNFKTILFQKNADLCVRLQNIAIIIVLIFIIFHNCHKFIDGLLSVSNGNLPLSLQAAVVGNETTEYSEVNQTVAAEATQGQPTYLNIPTKNIVG